MFMAEFGSDSPYALLGVNPDASPAQIREARDRLVEQLRERQRRESTNREELIERQKAVNAAGEVLARPARREEYDRANPQLKFFSIRTAAAPMFASAADLLAAAAAAVSAHLEAAGVPAAVLTDLDRTDFSADFTRTPLLDGRDGDE